MTDLLPRPLEANRKPLLLEELGHALLDQLYAPPLDDQLVASNASIIEHLRSNVSNAPTPSSASYRSGSTRTLIDVDSTPATSVDGRGTFELSPESSYFSYLNPSSRPQSKASSLPQDQSEQEDNQECGVFSLEDFSTMTAIQRLTALYGRVANMGMLDPSYRFFVNKSRTAALSFKIQNRVAIVGGDPLCEPNPLSIQGVLDEFAEYRRQRRLGIAFMGVSRSFVEKHVNLEGSKTRRTSIRFGTERVLNPQTNDILFERSGKRIAVQNRQLLHPDKGGITLGVYVPAMHGSDTQLQEELVAIYDAWRAERNGKSGPQAFITVYNPFALPSLMTFVYSRGPDNQINGFAALRRLGNGGYHIDPYIAAPGSPKGISDLLIVASMALLHRAGVSPLAHMTREFYGLTFQRLPIQGKKTYHDKFRPDPEQDSDLYIVFPDGFPGPRHMLAMMHMANISLRKVMWADMQGWMSRRKSKDTLSEPSPETAPANKD
ncbi:hypothetical protein N7470_001372 [Penicillium chermesinum]|nr:hypothetical protein N7470_001372 [Penicillium chermesinum]